MKKELSRIIADARKEALKRDYVVKSCALFATVIFPIAEALLRTFKPTDPQTLKLWWTFFLSIAFLHLLTALVTLLKVVDIQRYYFEFTDTQAALEESQKRNQELEQESSSAQHAMVALKNSSDQLQRILLELASETKPSRDTLENNLDRIFHVFQIQKEKVFGYLEGSSLFNLTVYLYNPSTKQLEVIKRWSDERIPFKNRAWKPPEGHVGYTFATKKGTCYNPDISTQRELWMGSEEDKKYYRSIISTPIAYKGLAEDSEFRGVLVLTSNVAGQFNEGVHKITVESISKLLTIFFNATRLTNENIFASGAPQRTP